MTIYDKNTGECINAVQGGGTNKDIGWCITSNNNNEIYAAGSFKDDADFGRFSLNNFGSTDVFVVSPFQKIVQQIIELKQGWNIISTHLNPKDLLIENIFANSISDILIVKNSAGNIYFPELGINNITNWNISQGYKVYAKNDFNLIIEGEKLDPSNNPIDLGQGWSIISYLLDTELDIETAIASISDNILIIKDGSGNIFFPSLNINNIINMKPGNGYKIYMNEADQLTYPGD